MLSTVKWLDFVKYLDKDVDVVSNFQSHHFDFVL